MRDFLNLVSGLAMTVGVIIHPVKPATDTSGGIANLVSLRSADRIAPAGFSP
ncbi:hypothetical protein [Sedimentitalea sp.]|uniref:hypothetical protein n=1 Tax=Sedimentitalea sp. TaxID=2048915 RepID=UPI003299A434